MRWDINRGKSCTRPGPPCGFGLTEGKSLFWQPTTATQDTLKGLVLEIWDYLLLWVVLCLLGAPREEYSQRGEWLMQFIAEWRCTRASSTRMQMHSWVASTYCSQTVKVMSYPVLSSPSQSWHSLEFWVRLTSVQPLGLAKVILIILAQTDQESKLENTQCLNYYCSLLLLKLLSNNTTSLPLQPVCICSNKHDAF